MHKGNLQKKNRGPEKIFFLVDTDLHQTHKKMFNVTNQKGNANQNHNKASLHTCQNGYYQKKTSIGENVEKGEFLFIVYGISIATVENRMEVPQKIENETTTYVW